MVAGEVSPAPAKKASRKPSVATVVAAHRKELAGIAADRKALYAWAQAHGMDNRSSFPHFKKALKELGLIDWDAVSRDKEAAQKADDAARRKAAATGAKHLLVLHCDAKASANRWAVCGEDGAVLWYGRFFDDDRDYNGEQSSGELAAALKAVWLASKVREAVGGTLLLRLRVDANWLALPCGKALALRERADRLGIALKVEWIRGTSNPADKWTTAAGFKKWQENDLAALVRPNEPDAEEEEGGDNE